MALSSVQLSFLCYAVVRRIISGYYFTHSKVHHHLAPVPQILDDGDEGVEEDGFTGRSTKDAKDERRPLLVEVVEDESTGLLTHICNHPITPSV